MLPERAAREVVHRSWGTVEGLGEIPGELPEPLASVAVLAVPSRAGGEGLEVEFDEGRGGTWAAFDVPDEALVTVVALRGDELDVVLRSESPADKAVFATGDGTWRAHVPGDGLLVVASPAPIAELDRLVLLATGADDPLAVLVASLPDDVVARHHRR
jgi:hypothetical protein